MFSELPSGPQWFSAALHTQDDQIWRGSPEASVFVSPDASNMQPGCRPHCSSSRGCCVKAQGQVQARQFCCFCVPGERVFSEKGTAVPPLKTQAAVWRCWPSEVIWSAGCKEGSPCLGRAGRVSGFGSYLQRQKMPRCP